MTKKRVAINGFGRMGRLAMRIGWDAPGYEIVHVNDPNGTAKLAAHLLEFDSVRGRWQRSIAAQDNAFTVDGQSVTWSTQSHLGETPWADLGVDIVLECSGAYKDALPLAPLLDAVGRVVVSTPIPGAPNIVMGINDGRYDLAEHRLVTAASCTTNALAPVVKVMHETFGITHGMVTTMHAVTNTQRVVDRFHKDPRRARSCAESLIPTTTGSAKAIVGIFPELEGKLTSMAVRVPLQNTSIIDCVFELSRAITREEVNRALRDAAEGPLQGYLGYETRPLVSIDFVGDTHSSVIDALSTAVLDGTMVKILAWYDSEWGYVSRMMELLAKVAAST